MKDKDLQFWYFLIEGKLDEKTGSYGNFYTYGKRCGEALAESLAVAKEEGLIEPVVLETMRLDNLEDFEIPEKAEKVNDNTFMLPSFSFYKINKDEYFFKPPVGIVFSTIDGELETELIKEKFVAYDKNENGIYEFQMVVDRTRLNEIFFKCFDFIEPVDAFWIYICAHWLEQKRELWASKSLTDKEKIIQFLKKNQVDMIENGFVDLVVHSSVGKTNLMLCEHKKIQLHTESEEVFKKFIDSVVDIGFEQTEEFYSIEFGYHHWHYRPVNSLDRDDLKVMLIDNEFENISLEE